MSWVGEGEVQRVFRKGGTGEETCSIHNSGIGNKIDLFALYFYFLVIRIL